jgi:HAD superfamily hydrolase (TIGR01509 family)
MSSGFSSVIFDVDGVLVASPHERAWREALGAFTDPAPFTTEFYQAYVAGRPRMDGARETLQRLGIADAAARATAYADAKQALVEKLIAAGEFEAFPDAVRFAVALRAAGLRLALASSSKNADAMLHQLSLPDGSNLLTIFAADLSGREVPRGKPDPALFLMAAEALGARPEDCVVIEDAPAGVQAARAGGMGAIGVARLGDEALLQSAGAHLVVTRLDQVDVCSLAAGTLRAHAPNETPRMHEAFEPTKAPEWVLTHRGYNILTESGVESRFAIGNGFLGMRAARSVSRGPTWVSWLGFLRWASWPRCYVAGLFDVPNLEPPVPALVPVADWSRVRILLDGKAVLALEGEVLRSARQLDMRRGLLLSGWTHRSPAGILITGRELRLLSQADRATGMQLFQFTVDRDDVEVTVEASFSFSGSGLDPMQLAPDFAAGRTEGSGKAVSMAGAASLRLGDAELTPERPFPLRWTWSWRSVAGRVAELERFVGVARTDTPGADPAPGAKAALARARALGWREALEVHEDAWARRWSASDVVIEGDPDIQRATRFASYHLISAANPEDETVSVGARALTGDAYLGHVFWDTEVYLLPYYTIVWPQAARAMLMYRYHTLPGARIKAAKIGYLGALYAWESADTGIETTPEHVISPTGERVEILSGRLEQHISADIAYAVWQYWRATGDDDFLLSAGAEIILETARFWASRATLEEDGKRHIRHVIGPDEYHEDVDDNAFTNVMARWNIAHGLELVDLLKARWPDRATMLLDKLDLRGEELADWRDAVARMEMCFDPRTGIYEQFAGFNALDPFDLATVANRTDPIDVVIGRARTAASQIVKQADVVALIALAPDAFPGDTAMANFRYYEPRTAHGSSLSAVMHALVAARLGDTELALTYLRRTATFDPDPMSAGGVRIAGLGGFWQAVVTGFGGLDITGDMLSIDPKPPAQWRSLSFRTCWRGRSIAVRIANGRVEATLVAGESVEVRLAGAARRLMPGEPVEAPLRCAPAAMVEAQAAPAA